MKFTYISEVSSPESVLLQDGRIRDTLLHEMCHAAAWLIDGSKSGHGSCWKLYANKANAAFPRIPPVTTRHTYDIKTKFVYCCSVCSQNKLKMLTISSFRYMKEVITY
ncbi:unnamed protein product [Soboliphyme baturini]|uniref:SprT-like domain-containing protein n=1 Tax=Soboliphyme baturini TaxID=241478 RepID=A0A183IVF2_9BILA|nr:unnamed protein product [Soboliphyme baturini]